MAKQIRQVGRAFLYILPLVAIGLLLVLPPKESAAAYADPFWTNTSSSPECECANCPCEGPSEWSPEGVSVRTGDFRWGIELFRTPGKVNDTVFGLTWRAMIDGHSQLGNGVLPSWELSVEKEILNEVDPDANGGHEVYVRLPSGLIRTYDWDGTEYSTSDCQVHDVLSTDVSGNYVLTNPWGDFWTFDSSGMLDSFDDRNGNTVEYGYTSYKMTSFTDDRGKSYTIGHNAAGFMDSLEDYAEREWTFEYDTNGNLIDINFPATTDQPLGFSVVLDYDASDRLISVTDGRSKTVLEPAWLTGLRKIDSVDVDEVTVDYSYYTGRTERSDQNDDVQRWLFTGQTITQHDHYIDSAAEYATSYNWNGTELSYIVYPEGNRTDFTWDNEGNLTEKRLRVEDTSTNAATDIVHSWTYGSPVPLTYTDPESNQWTYGYDAYYNLTSITHPTVSNPTTQTASESFTYNSYGQRLTHVDEESLRTKYVYFSTGDSIHLLQKVQVGPDGSILETEFTYDSAGNVQTKEDPRGNSTTYIWDDLRRLKQTQGPSTLIYKVKYEYDANGNMTKREVENKDKDGARSTSNPWFTTTYVYTDLNQLSSITEEIDASTTRTTSFYYDAVGNRYRVVKPEGNEERWTFDERGLVLTHVRGYGTGDASTVEYAYDDNGNLETFTDGRDNA